MMDNLAPLAAAVVIVLAALALLAALVVIAVRALRRHDAEAADKQLVELARLQAETAVRIEGMRDLLAGRQAELHRAVNERLDSVSHHLNQSMTTSRQHTVESLQKLNERLVVIDTAQRNITDLASQVTSLQGVLTNKQQRGAFGQGRMELIVQDGLPKSCYEFQFTLSNKSRPDCAVFLPDRRPLVIDAKFPLEAITAFRDAKGDDERKQAAARLRQDLGRHVSSIADKYLIPGETQDLALMFVPSESIYADLHDGFDDVVQKAFRSKVVIVSPSLLMLAIQVVQQIQRDSRMREAADQIHAEVGHLMDDLKRLHERVLKLQQHFGQANEDVRQILISAEKIERRGTRIQEVEFGGEDRPATDAVVIPAPMPLRLHRGE
ncbi:MAG TPA: DNA recombination protein RmuC [Xanthobacteraceae bacterium]|jgi:DNA recombination protein RmuC|nr:DNA recombination protein RmuC [Xanthobacteraceae bacterium]